MRIGSRTFAVSRPENRELASALASPKPYKKCRFAALMFVLCPFRLAAALLKRNASACSGMLYGASANIPLAKITLIARHGKTDVVKFAK